MFLNSTLIYGRDLVLQDGRLQETTEAENVAFRKKLSCKLLVLKAVSLHQFLITASTRRKIAISHPALNDNVGQAWISCTCKEKVKGHAEMEVRRTL